MLRVESSERDVRDIADLLRSAATVTSAAADVESAIGWILGLVCELTGWPVGHLYSVDEQGRELVSLDLWYLDDGERYAPFKAATEQTRLRLGEGLPGRVASTGVADWIEDVRVDENFPRRAAARACGLGAGMGIPISTSRGVEGVMEFFAAEAVEADERLLELIAHVGVQVGNLYDRHRASEELRSSQASLAEAERLARLGSWSWRIADNCTTWSAGVYGIFGIDPDGPALTFDEYLGLVDPEDRDRVTRAIQLTVETKEPFDHEYRIVRPDGEPRWLQARGEAVVDDDGSVVSLMGFCQDVTSRRETEERRRRAQAELARHQAILEGIARGRSMQQTLDAVCRDIEDQFPGASCSVLLAEQAERSLRHAAAPSLPAAFQRAIDGLPIAIGMGACGTAAARGELVVVEDTSTDVITAAFTELAEEYGLRSVWSLPLSSPTGELLGTFALYRSVRHRPDEDEVRAVTVAGNLAAMAIERDRAERALLTAAHVDPVTGLPNRSRFLAKVDEQLKYPGARIAVMFLDLDRFKWINDSLGHPAGDTILVEVARRLRRVLRARDVVARFGGDEFTILVTDASKRIVDAVAQRVEAEFTAPFRLDGGEFFLSVSAGIALHDGTVHADAYSLVRDADAAMYSAKEGGRARHAVFDERLRERVVARVTLESELRRAIARDEFVLEYQPIQDLSTGQWSGVEALARWDHPSRGMLAPDAFIPLAEETGLIVPLGLLLIDRIAGQAAAWFEAGCGVRVAANISAIQLSDPNISDVVAGVLERHRLDPAYLLLEVTESTLMERLDTVHSVLNDLSDIGVRVLIDDFGTGYSSIARLDELPVIGVKIDKRFTRELGVDPNAVRILSAIAALARAMDLRVIAEGIETEAALALAAEAGCDFAQGFHLGRPFPPERWQEISRPH